MSKGSKPAGSTTTTTINPTAQAQLPFMQDMWGQAQSLYQNNPLQYYPGQTLADYMAPNPYLTSGYNQLYQQGANTNSALLPGANAAWGNAVGGGMGYQYSPATGFYQDYASGAGYVPQSYQGLQQQAQQAGTQYANQVGGYANPMAQYAMQAGANNNAGLNALMKTASGAYLNSNPYIDAAIQAAQDPVTRNYQTAIAPSMDAMFSGGGRYGSGAMAGAVNTGQQNLVRGLGDISSNMMNANYARERAAMDQAAQQYASLYNSGLGLGISGLGNAANVAQAGAGQYWKGQDAQQAALDAYRQAQQYGVTGLQSGFNTGNQAILNALNMYPQIAAAQYSGPNAQITAGQGVEQLNQQFAAYQQKQIQDQMARFYGNQNAPYDTLAKYSGFLGNPVAMGGTTSTPYFQNQAANILSGLSGTAGLARNFGLFGSGGLGGLGGSTAAGLGTALDFGGGGAALGVGDALGLGGATAAELAAGAGGSSLAAAAAPMAFTIICTELMRQGRLPKRWWIASAKAFVSCPEIVKRGYYVWAIPSVRHLRRRPDSRYSRLLATVFNWRAEDIAARAGVKGARRLWRGRAVTAALALPCLALGVICPAQDWRQVYDPGEKIA